MGMHMNYARLERKYRGGKSPPFCAGTCEASFQHTITESYTLRPLRECIIHHPSSIYLYCVFSRRRGGGGSDDTQQKSISWRFSRYSCDPNFSCTQECSEAHVQTHAHTEKLSPASRSTLCKLHCIPFNRAPAQAGKRSILPIGASFFPIDSMSSAHQTPQTRSLRDHLVSHANAWSFSCFGK